MTSIINALKKVSVFPLMGEALNTTNTLLMDFSPLNVALEEIDLSNTPLFDSYVFGLLNKENKRFGMGGFFENRMIYKRSAVFATAEEDFRNIHLGVDIWAAAGTPVYCPLNGKVHSFQDNSGFGNYGPTIILEHQLEQHVFYTLYGHLALTDLDALSVGQKILAGQKFCHLGPFPENGDWPPHLHFQLMTDLDGNSGDFPGVCSKKDMEKYRQVCLDPDLIIRFGMGGKIKR